MPKTRAEKETLGHFKEEYKDPEKAKRVYYALRNKNKKFDRSQGGGFSSKKAQAEWWHSRISRLPAQLKSKVLGLVEVDPDVNWWMKRIQAIDLNKSKEGHTR